MMSDALARDAQAGRFGHPGCDHELACLIEGQGPDLVLLHGGVGSANHWIRNIAYLARSYRVRAFDLPGYGGSPAFPEEMSDDSYFERVARAILEDGHGRTYLVGFSFGGSVAAAAVRFLGKRLAALCLVAPGGFGVPADRKVDMRPVRPREGVAIDPRAAARHNLNEVMLADPHSVEEATIDLHLENIARARFNSRRLSWQDRIERDLAEVYVPLQLIWGEQDRMATPSISARVERCRRVRPQLRLDLVPGAGHWVQYERPGEFNRVLTQFLDGISASTKEA
jgi:2-hydroxy-6-oxonona-2,4-dienedioate hydrolase